VTEPRAYHTPHSILRRLSSLLPETLTGYTGLLAPSGRTGLLSVLAPVDFLRPILETLAITSIYVILSADVEWQFSYVGIELSFLRLLFKVGIVLPNLMK
jgi:hypothetical protein